MKLNQFNSTSLYKSSNSDTSNGYVASSLGIYLPGVEGDVEVSLLIAGLAILGLILLCLAGRPRNTNICFLNMVQFCYEWCCCRLDCASKLNPNDAIMRYIEEPPLDTNEFIDNVLTNEYIKSILNSFALELPEYFLSILPSGSLREGFGKILPSTSVLASDYDIMLIPDAALVGHSTKTYSGNEKPLFATVESQEIEEGFLWLRLENEYMLQWKDLCIRRQTEGEGYSYLSSHKVHDLISKTFYNSEMITQVIKRMTGSKSGAKVHIEKNGPALTLKVVTRSFKTCGMKCCKNLWKCCERERDDIIFYCDFTFSLYCPQWPDKSNWFTTERRKEWPSEHIVNQILGVGCHVVPKPSTDSIVKLHTDQPTNITFSQSPGLEWRYSFSQAEIVLAAEIPEKARGAYLALKAVNKRYFSKGFIKALPSYAMKCVMLQVMEETESQFWERHHECVDVLIKMLDILYQHLNNRVFPHYWIPSINLIKDLDIPTLDTLCHKVNTVRNKPQAFVAENWLEVTRCLRLNCCSCCAFGKSASLYKGVVSNILYVKGSCCPLCLIPCSYSSNSCCLGPCPYDKLNMDVY